MPSRAPRVAAKAGASPSPSPVATAIATAKSQTSGPKLTFISKGNGLVGLIVSVTRSSQWEKKNPAAPPPKASSTLSVSNCRTSRQRPAPNARRTDISRRRSPARANSSPARFAQASVSTSPTSSPMRPSTSRNCVGSIRTTRPAENSRTCRPSRRSSPTSGCCTFRARAAVSSAASAVCIDTPLASRTTAWNRSAPSFDRMSPSSSGASAAPTVTGTKISAGLAGKTPWNPPAAMPASVALWPFTCSVLPTARGSASSRRLQNRSLTTTTGSAPNRSVSGERRRPAAGATPSASKYSGETRWPKTRSAPCSPSTATLNGTGPRYAVAPSMMSSSSRIRSKAGYDNRASTATSEPGSRAPGSGAR